MKRMTLMVTALALVLGLAQCKKEQPAEPQDGQVRITLNVDNGGASKGSRVNVSGVDVNFTTGDKILVVSDSKYLGDLIHNGTNFSGDIIPATEGATLYFYFCGNKPVMNVTTAAELVQGETYASNCYVNISDQTSGLPVISMAPANETYSSSVTTYTARLHNKCSLAKYSIDSPSFAPVSVKGMNNKVIISFNKADSDADNNGFSYDMDGEGIIKMAGKNADNETWAIVLPNITALAPGEEGTVYTNGYTGCRPSVPNLSMNRYYDCADESFARLTITTTDGNKTIDLSTVTENTVVEDGWTLTGTLGANVKISIADGAAVTLSGVSINAEGSWTNGDYAGITCAGDATILLDGTNTVKGFHENYPGIIVPEDNTLSINGSGSLAASSNGKGAGIGAGYSGSASDPIACGNIVILGGTITANGGSEAAGIGGANNSSCGNITISGGTVTATGGTSGAGIGSGNSAQCGAILINGGTVSANGGAAAPGIGVSGGGDVASITITDGVTQVVATKGGSSAYSIFGGTGSVLVGGKQGNVEVSPFYYPSAAPATGGHALADSEVGELVGTDGLAYYAADKDNLPTGVTAAGMVAYKDGSNGLVIALADEASTMDWSTACGASGAAAHTPIVTGQTWKLPSREDWQHIRDAYGYQGTALNTAIENVGGTAIPTVHINPETWSATNIYWSSTEFADNTAQAHIAGINSGGEIFAGEADHDLKDASNSVRAVLAF